MMQPLLAGRVALITGAARGIGKGIAETFAREGAQVILTGRHADTLEAAAAGIRARGGAADYLVADVSQEDQIQAMTDTAISRFGRIDILVNNAGITREMPFLDMPVAVFDEIMNTNMRGLMLVTRAVLPHMLRQKYGRIVNIGSGAGQRGMPGNTAYSTSKAAVVCFTQALGDEIRRMEPNIRINVICTGPVDTEMFRESACRDFLIQGGNDILSVETLANSALYLASDMSEGINSQILATRGSNRW